MDVTRRSLFAPAKVGPNSSATNWGAWPRTADRPLNGLSNQEICDELYVSLSTVMTHLTSIQTKLALRNRVEVAIWVHDRGLR